MSLLDEIMEDFSVMVDVVNTGSKDKNKARFKKALTGFISKIKEAMK